MHFFCLLSDDIITGPLQLLWKYNWIFHRPDNRKALEICLFLVLVNSLSAKV